MDYKTQYQMYLSQASAALEDACAKFLPEESEVTNLLYSFYQYLCKRFWQYYRAYSFFV